MNETNIDLPSNWVWASLDELMDRLQYGFTAKAKQNSAGPKFLRITDINEGVINWDTVPNCEIRSSEIEKYRLFEGDIVFARSGSIEKACMIVDPPEAIFASYLIRGRPLHPTIGIWTKYFVQSTAYLSQIVAAASGIGMQNVNAKKIGLVSIPIAPLPEQSRITSKIESLQSRSTKAKKALDAIPPLLEKFRQSVLSSAFRGDLTADWRAQNPDIEPAEKLLERIRKERRKHWEEDELAKMKANGKTPKDDKWKKKYKEPEPVDSTDLPELPEGWCWATLSELSTAVNPIGYGVLQPGNEVENGAKLVRVCDLEDGKVLTEQLRTISSEVDNHYARTRLKGGELLVTVVGTIGRVAIAPDEITGANVARAVARLTPTYPIKASWLLRMLSSSFLQDWLVKGAREVARKTLNIGVLEKTPLPLCSVSEMQEGLDKVEKLLSCLSPMKKIAQENMKYISSLDQSILAKAFRGELVPQDPNDEPASQLLARIDQERATLEAGTKKRGRKGRTEKII